MAIIRSDFTDMGYVPLSEEALEELRRIRSRDEAILDRLEKDERLQVEQAVIAHYDRVKQTLGHGLENTILRLETRAEDSREPYSRSNLSTSMLWHFDRKRIIVVNFAPDIAEHESATGEMEAMDGNATEKDSAVKAAIASGKLTVQRSGFAQMWGYDLWRQPGNWDPSRVSLHRRAKNSGVGGVRLFMIGTISPKF